MCVCVWLLVYAFLYLQVRVCVDIYYIYIYIYRVIPPKNRTHIIFWLKFKNLILPFFLGYKVDSVHEKLGPSYSPTCPEVRVYKIRIILLYFCRSNKKVYGFCYFCGGHPIYIYMYIYILRQKDKDRETDRPTYRLIVTCWTLIKHLQHKIES